MFRLICIADNQDRGYVAKNRSGLLRLLQFVSTCSDGENSGFVLLKNKLFSSHGKQIQAKDGVTVDVACFGSEIQPQNASEALPQQQA